MYFHNQVSLLGGFLFFYLYCHTPNEADNACHEKVSYMQAWVKDGMWKSGELDAFRKVK